MKITEYHTKEILNWLGEVADHAQMFEEITMFRDTAVLIRQLQAELNEGREQGRREDRFVSELELLEALKMARAEAQPVACEVVGRAYHESFGDGVRLKLYIDAHQCPVTEAIPIGTKLYFRPSPSVPVGVAEAWQQGYHQGVLDERISEANIGIAGFAAKVEPARINPYLSQQPAAVGGADKDDARRYRALVATGKYVPAMQGWGLSCSRSTASKAELDAAADALAAQQPAAEDGMADFEIHAGGEYFASVFGQREQAWKEAMHYVSTLSPEDGEPEVFEVTRRKVFLAAAHKEEKSE